MQCDAWVGRFSMLALELTTLIEGVIMCYAIPTGDYLHVHGEC